MAEAMLGSSRGAGSLSRADGGRLIALLLPVALLGGAYAFQYLGGLYPCEMCWWQRYPHAAAILLAALAFTAPAASQRSRIFTLLAAVAIAISGLIGVYHAGVEYKIFEGFTTCTSTVKAASTQEMLKQLMAVPLIRCDQVQWSLFGVSLAGWNAIFSLGGAVVIGWLTWSRGRPQ